MEKEELSPEQSLQLINQMITEVKQEFRNNGFYLLFWGWLVFFSAIVNFVLLKMGNPFAYYVWPVLMPLGGIISTIYAIAVRRKEKKRAKTFIDRAMGYTWLAFMIALGIVLSSGAKLGFDKVYPFVLLLYGIGTFITGGIIKFPLLVFGGICCWVLAIAAFYVPFDIQLLLLSLALIISYIIPGHVLNYRNRKNV